MSETSATVVYAVEDVNFSEDTAKAQGLTANPWPCLVRWFEIEGDKEATPFHKVGYEIVATFQSNSEAERFKRLFGDFLARSKP